MKKIVLIIAGVFLLNFAFAQFTYGPKLGGNFSKLAGDNFKPGLQAGGFLNGEFLDKMGLQVDFLWTLKGTNNLVNYDSLGRHISTPITNVTYYRFVDIPICFYFPISKHIRGFIGPQWSVFKKAVENTTLPNNHVTTTDITGIQTSGSYVYGFDFNFESPLIIGMRFVNNKFSQGRVSQENLSSVMLNIAYKMSW